MSSDDPTDRLDGAPRERWRPRERLGLSAGAPVVSCFEAGRDGFWLARYLQAHGIINYVVDSASIEVIDEHDD